MTLDCRGPLVRTLASPVLYNDYIMTINDYDDYDD